MIHRLRWSDMGKRAKRSGREKGAKKPWLVRGLNALGMSMPSGLEWVLGWAQSLLVAGVLAWFILSFVLVRMTVPTGSMEPTIAVGTSFFVDKISYNFRDPQAGDIIVFWKDEGPGKGRQRLVKRLIAVGGQAVQIQDCRNVPEQACGVYVDGQRLLGPPFERRYLAAGEMGEQTWTVPREHYFVLGDNSPISEDSRYWGFVRQEDFIGEPFLRVWPLEQFGFMNGYFSSPR